MDKSGTTVFLCMLHVLLLPVVKPMYSIAFRTGVQVYRYTGFSALGEGIVLHKFRLPVGLFGLLTKVKITVFSAQSFFACFHGSQEDYH